MSDTKYTQINFKAKVKPIKPINDEFTLCKAYVQGIGKNRNRTYMSKENVLKYAPTLDYCPVVGHIIEAIDEKGNVYRYMGGHDYEITEDWEIKDITVPYGVVVSDTREFEEIEEYGEMVEYMTTHIIMWTGRYPELKDAIYAEDFWFNQSMELNIFQYRPYEEDSNYTELLEWSYSALCLLGKADDKSSPEHTEPCFINAKVIPVEFAKSEFAEILHEMKEKITFCLDQSSAGEVDINNDGGNSTMKKLHDEFAESTETPEKVEDKTVEGVDDATDTPDTDDTPETNTEGNTAEDTADEESVENANTDFEVKYAELEARYAELETKHTALEKEFAEYKNGYSYANTEVSVLREAAVSALFAKFEEKIGKSDDIKLLKENADTYSYKDLEKECLCIVGKFSMGNDKSIKFSLKDDFVDNGKQDSPYGGVMEHYLKK